MVQLLLQVVIKFSLICLANSEGRRVWQWFTERTAWPPWNGFHGGYKLIIVIPGIGRLLLRSVQRSSKMLRMIIQLPVALC